ncbi:MAG: ATP-binding protein [Anaerolineae bacterium]|jgi:two-component system phosphate regulon sensor histidine kinase PhoR
MFHSLRWRIAVPYLILILLTMGGLAVCLSHLVRQSHLSDLQGKLTAEARLIGDAVKTTSEWDPAESKFDVLAQHYADLLDARVTFIGADGTVLGESHADRSQMDNHLRRPEVQEALTTGQGHSTRLSRTVGYQMMYAAVLVTSGDRVQGFARVALPVSQVEAQVARLRRVILLAALLVVLAAALLAIIIADRVARPVQQLTEVVHRMTVGDLSARLLPTTQDEIGELTRSFNQMATRLRNTISTLTEQQNQLSAVLDTMADGVLISDDQGLVRLINPAAEIILGASQEQALGRSFAQVARDHRMIDLWQRCFQEREEQVEPVEMDRQQAFLQVIVTPLQEGDDRACLIILQDLTRMRRLETVRRDFISNISHELRTPMASLKALVDTLRDGALEDPPAARRFLDRMDAEVDALTQVVQELLQLSRIESGRAPIRMEPVTVADAIVPPVERLRPQAERADLDLALDVSSDLPLILSDSERLQQVVTNLVHNAIKFTPPAGRIEVSVRKLLVSEDGIPPLQSIGLEPGALELGEWVLIAVHDTGVGIPVDDLRRIFERFYKADRARSGGGTGLGLSIAKHIVQAHDGHIWSESLEGQGATFYVALPALTSRNKPLTPP